MRRVSLLLFLLAPCGLFAQVSYERLVRAESESHNWLTYSGSYRSQRFSALKQITPENVAKLKPVWVYQIKEPGTHRDDTACCRWGHVLDGAA